VTSGAVRSREARHARPSRIPAVTVLLLVVFVMLGVGLSFALTRDEGSVAGLDVGVRAAAYAGEEPGSYNAAELEALARPLPAGAAALHVPVLMYHYVDDEPPPKGPYADGLTVRTPDFVEELEYLVENGYHTVRLSDVYLAMAGVKQLPEKPVALTFDDGGLDNYTVAFDLLREHGQTATFFVIAKTVGGDGQMTWEQLREMAGAGMSIQSHTFSHPDLREISDERLQSELVDSRATIAEAVGEPGYALCYPAGAYDDRVIEAAKAAGYVMAVVTDEGEVLEPEAIFEIRRARVQAYLPLESFANLVD
jgi:peptidoglycan/xylan/chitin deacetylase (PgdA/CDA1 family)